MKDKKDILNTLKFKENPLRVPEGYFDDFQLRATRISLCKTTPAVKKIYPRVAIAATLLILMGLSGMWMRDYAFGEDYSFEDYIVSSDNYINTVYNLSEETLTAEVEISEEDIVEYLIYSGTNTDIIEIHGLSVTPDEE